MAQMATELRADCNAALAKFFPLPLTVVEKFMLLDGRDRYPMMCDIEVQLQGSVEQAPFEEALDFALQRAPFFRSIIQEDGSRGPCWHLTDRSPPVEWAEYGVPYEVGYDDLIDLRQTPGLRVYVRRGTVRSSILLHFHHATSDGVGSVSFVEDLLVAYHNATAGSRPVEPRRWEPHRLLHRCSSSLENPGLVRGLYDVYCGIRGAASFFAQRPLPLTVAKPPLQASASRKQNGFITQECSPEATRALRNATSRQNATVNDFLLRDLFVTLHAWLDEHQRPVGHRHLRVLMPQSLRGRGDGAMPTTNDVGFAFLARRGTLCQRPDDLLTSLVPETTAIRNDRLSRHFIGGLGAVDKLRLLPRLLNGSSCFATAVLTNFGNSWRRFQAKLPPADGGLAAGNLVYDGLVGTPPCRPQTAATFCVTTTADRIRISLKHDPFHFTREESLALLTRYIAQIERSA